MAGLDSPSVFHCRAQGVESVPNFIDEKSRRLFEGLFDDIPKIWKAGINRFADSLHWDRNARRARNHEAEKYHGVIIGRRCREDQG